MGTFYMDYGTRLVFVIVMLYLMWIVVGCLTFPLNTKRLAMCTKKFWLKAITPRMTNSSPFELHQIILQCDAHIEFSNLVLVISTTDCYQYLISWLCTLFASLPTVQPITGMLSKLPNYLEKTKLLCRRMKAFNWFERSFTARTLGFKCKKSTWIFALLETLQKWLVLFGIIWLNWLWNFPWK